MFQAFILLLWYKGDGKTLVASLFPPPPPSSSYKRSLAKAYLYTHEMMLNFTSYMLFKLEIVAIKKDRRNKFFLVLASVSWSWKFHSFTWVCVTAVKQWASRIGVTLTWRRYLRPNEHWRQWSLLNTTWTDCSIKWTATVNIWTACKNKSSFLSCEAEFSAIISFKIRVFGLNTSCREYAN